MGILDKFGNKIGKFLFSVLLGFGVASAQTQGQYVGENQNLFFQPPQFQYYFNPRLTYYNFRVDDATMDFSLKSSKQKFSYYELRVAESMAELSEGKQPIHPKTLEEMAEKLDWRNIIFEFLFLDDSLVSSQGYGKQLIRCNKLILQKDNGDTVFPYIGLDYSPESRNLPVHKGVWYLANGKKSKEMKIGEGSDYSKRIIPYLISCMYMPRDDSEEEQEYVFDAGGRNILDQFKLDRAISCYVLGENGEEIPINLEDLR